MRTLNPRQPPILYGAYLLAALSLVWSGFAITDLMQSGKFGLSVAVAGDLGWITVLWAEHKGITIAGRRWPVIATGWAIAAGVAALLVVHGAQAGGTAQAVAGPFVVLVGKIVWAIALEALKDRTAPTPEQVAELEGLVRNATHEAAKLRVRTDTVINRIKAEAETTAARDEAEFQIALDRADKRASIMRRTPMELEASTPEPAADSGAIIAEHMRELIASMGDHVRDQAAIVDANTQANRAITDREQSPSIADLAREQVAITTDNGDAVKAILAIRPDASKASVAAAVRRARSTKQGPYM